MHLHILERARTGVAKDCAVHRHLTAVRALAARPDNAQRARRHAVDAPLRVAVHSADGDGEAAVVGADDVEAAVVGAGDVQAAVLTGVGRLVRVAVVVSGTAIAAGRRF